MSIAENYGHVADSVKRAALKCGRKHDDVAILAVSKTHSADKMLTAAACGARLFGESRVQEAIPKIEIVRAAYPDAVFHFIGKIQTNKAKKIVEYFSLIHSVDSVHTAQALNAAAEAYGKIQDILIQLNLAKEPQKNGVHMEDLEELIYFIKEKENLKLRGFMFIPPFEDEEEHNRKFFRNVKEIYNKYKNYSLDVLSMGMSGDYEIAISEGSTLVRIGTMIFGRR